MVLFLAGKFILLILIWMKFMLVCSRAKTNVPSITNWCITKMNINQMFYVFYVVKYWKWSLGLHFSLSWRQGLLQKFFHNPNLTNAQASFTAPSPPHTHTVAMEQLCPPSPSSPSDDAGHTGVPLTTGCWRFITLSTIIANVSLQQCCYSRCCHPDWHDYSRVCTTDPHLHFRNCITDQHLRHRVCTLCYCLRRHI